MDIHKVQHILQSCGDQTLFVVHRNSSSNIVLYIANRTNNKLLNPYVTIWRSDSDDIKQIKEVSEQLKKALFGVTVKKIKRGLYSMSLNILPNQQINIHLKKNGSCSAKMDLDGKYSRILDIFVHFTNNINIDYIKIRALYEETVITKTLQITADITKNFNLLDMINLIGAV